ncbi:VanW family protein [Euzebya tangerina]|uniref:VanW family protein n=1 Tax=Euzebya tangerina TaxID=591198 RepID=UPI0013C32B6A|nr:VanW family protein [Euzebya tangerina]
MSDPSFPTVTVRSGRNRQLWIIVALTAVVVALAAAAALRVAFSQLPPGTTVAGVDVRTPSDATNVARDISNQLISLPVELSTTAGSTTVPAGQLGAQLDVEALSMAAEEGTGADAWTDRFTGGGRLELPVEVTVAGGNLDPIVADVSSDPVDGDVTIAAGQIETTEPVVGIRVEPQQVTTAVTPRLVELAEVPAAEWPRPLTVPIEGEEIEPAVTQASVDAAVAELERIAEAEIELVTSVVPEDAQTVEGVGVPTREDASIVVTGPQLLELMQTRVDPDAIQVQRLQIIPNVENPPAALEEFLDDADVVPDMTVSVENRSPTPPREGPQGTGPGGPADQPRLADVTGITGDLVAEVRRPGLDADVEATITAIVEAAVAGASSAEVQGQPITDADPALLGITTPVSTYTTFFTPGEARVTNITRIAQILDGTLVPPGGNLEINHAVGERTEADGFVPSGAILEGEFITDVGGGVSQFATTFFNAMWFAGLDIITHTPHSFYFERYPAGREATIDFPGVDLEFNNNTPYWVLVDTATTADSVTVTFWSTPYFEVTQSIGPRVPVEGGAFQLAIERLAVAPEIPDPRDPEEIIPAISDDDRFVHAYGNPP